MSDFKPKSLIHYEQQVNDRYGTAPAPRILENLLPEFGALTPLAWKSTPSDKVSVFATNAELERSIVRELMRDGQINIPIHPIAESRYAPDELLHAGQIKFSASYRTVFYEPQEGDPFSSWVPDRKQLMFKLHLDEPLPGVPGDRRLTKETIEKCVRLSSVLSREMSQDPMGQQLEVLPEFFGITDGNSGFLMRMLPESGLIPVFSLYSKDRSQPEKPPIIVTRMREIFGGDSLRAAGMLGSMLARPLIRSLLAGFRAGFSLEMHAQNSLVRLGNEGLIDMVYFRDMEGVLIFNEFRADRDLAPLFSNSPFSGELDPKASMHRYYNRNLDHDLGRIFSGALHALHESGYFQRREHRVAVRSICSTVRSAIKDADLGDIGWLGQFSPYSRAPWGNGLRLGHYFRTQYR